MINRTLLCASVAISVSMIAGCPSNNKDDDAPQPQPTAAPTPAPTPTPLTTTAVVPEDPAAKIQPRVKAEVDNRADGITGSPLAVAGAQASLQVPTGWQTTKGDPTIAASPDNKAQVAASALAAGTPASAKLGSATAAMGLSSCTWGTPEALTIGKTKLAGMGADGICTRGGAQVRTAYVAPSAEGLLVIGAWDETGDSASVFGAMRSIAKATGGGDPTGIAACCAAIAQNQKSAPPEQQLIYGAAIAACNAARNDPNGRAALAAVRAALAGAGVPAACK